MDCGGYVGWPLRDEDEDPPYFGGGGDGGGDGPVSDNHPVIGGARSD